MQILSIAADTAMYNNGTIVDCEMYLKTCAHASNTQTDFMRTTQGLAASFQFIRIQISYSSCLLRLFSLVSTYNMTARDNEAFTRQILLFTCTADCHFSMSLLQYSDEHVQQQQHTRDHRYICTQSQD